LGRSATKRYFCGNKKIKKKFPVLSKEYPDMLITAQKGRRS